MLTKVNNLQVYYEIIGKGKPVIMIHGLSPDHRMMKGCMEPIFHRKECYQRFYFDLPGMGKSESSEHIANSDAILETILGFIDTIIPNQNFLLVGLSYGGYLARGIISKVPERVDGLLLICPVIHGKIEIRDIPTHVVIEKDKKLLSKISSEEADILNNRAVVQNSKVLKRFKNEIISGIEIADKPFLETLKKNGYEFSFNVDSNNNIFNRPTLIIMGKQDSCVGYKDAWTILDNYPRATFAVMDKAGHNLQIEQDKVFNFLVKEWLNRTEEFL